MLGTKLHWVDGPWLGRLALAARPRGGDWLGDEVSFWQQWGIDTVVSLLEPDEERDLELAGEGDEVRAHGMTFRALPIADRQVPASKRDLTLALGGIEDDLLAGRNVVLHCRQGIGRTGLIAAALLILRGVDPEAAVVLLGQARGVEVPETREQRLWLNDFAESLAAVG